MVLNCVIVTYMYIMMTADVGLPDADMLFNVIPRNGKFHSLEPHNYGVKLGSNLSKKMSEYT